MSRQPVVRVASGLLAVLFAVAAGYSGLVLTRPASAGGTTYIVTSLGDSGIGDCDDSCTFRQAINAANVSADNRIQFDVPNCPGNCLITPSTPLPTIVQPMTVDGTTQVGYSEGSPVVVIDGSSLAAGQDGLTIQANDVEIVGIRVSNAPRHGIFQAATTQLRLTITDSRISDNGADGLNAAVSDTLIIDGSSFTGNGESGIWASSSNMTDANFINMDARNNGFDGVNVAVTGTLSFTGSVVEGNTESGLWASSSTMSNAVIENSFFVDNGHDGANVAASSTLNVNGSAFTGNDESGLWAANSTVADAFIEENEFGMNGFDGVRVAASNTLTVLQNQIYLNGANGLHTSAFTTPLGAIAMNNVVSNMMAGVTVRGPGILLHHNRFAFNGTGLLNEGAGMAPAEDNWWACNEGPNQPGCDTTDGGVDGDPWLVLTVDVAPDPLAIGDMATLSGNVNLNSNGEDTSGDGHIPDGLLMLLYADAGTISIAGINVTKETVYGVATAQFSANVAPDEVTLGADFDNAEVTTQLSVIEPVSTPTPTPTPGPTATPTPTPTPTAEPEGLQGDVDCDGDVDAVDALKILQFIAGVPFEQQPGCPEIGEQFGDQLFGDVDCDGDIDAVDALKILQSIAAIPFGQMEPCVDIGQPLA